MANSKLLFFDKQGEPLNFEYIGPTGPTPADDKFVFSADTSSLSPGTVDISSLAASDTLVFNVTAESGYNILNWATEVSDFIQKGAQVTLSLSVLGTAQVLKGRISSIDITNPASGISVVFLSTVGSKIISNGKRLYVETTYVNRPCGYYYGKAYFDLVSAGLVENYQIFVLQEFLDSVTGGLIHGYPHTDLCYYSPGGSSKWRTRWESNEYGNVDVSDIIFTYKIQQNDPSAGGDPIIYNYPNLVYEIPGPTGDSYSTNGYLETSDNIGIALSFNVALQADSQFADVYERKLIVEDLTTSGPVKVMEIDFYGQVVGEDERLKVLTNNLGRSFFPKDSDIIRDHDPSEPLPDYLEINEKRKELMVAGEEIFPYIGSYRGLINAIKFFGYQDLRIKEYWLNIRYSNASLTPLQSTTSFLQEYKNQPGGYSQNILIKDVLDNPNSGKYRLVQTYGPNKDGQYVLDVSSPSTLVPTNTYKKTSLFGLYYDINRITDRVDPYGYPIANDAFMFSQEEVLLKLFALKNRLKETYLPLNARIVDITGEGVYFNVYNTKSWTDSVDRFDIDSGFSVRFSPNPDYGFIEDLRAFYVRNSKTSIQIPSNYDDVLDLSFSVYGASGDAFSVSGYNGYNPTISLQKGKRYVISNTSDSFDLVITKDPFLGPSGPYGIQNNGATASNKIFFDVNPNEVGTLYYYSTSNPTNLNGVINLLDPPVSDFGNTTDPLSNGQKYSPSACSSMLGAIEKFYVKKQNGEIIELGDNRYDPTPFLDPSTGQEYKVPVGMPVILELDLDRWSWDEMGVNWSSVSLPVLGVGDSVYIKGDDTSGSDLYIGQVGNVDSINYSTGVYTITTGIGTSTFDEGSLYASKQNSALLNWSNIDFSNFVDIEWVINKSANQSGSPYNFSFRGRAIDYYRLPHFLPYTGKYDITCNVYDSYNFKNVKIDRESIEVAPRTIDIDAWTRYRENEYYSWGQTVREWDDYNSIWEYPSEGLTYEDAVKEIPSELLEFANYGNSAYEGQNLEVKTVSPGSPSYAEFTFTQNTIPIESIRSYRIGTLSQYGYAEVRTSVPHGLSSGDSVYLEGVVDDLRGNWDIEISPGATGYTFTVPSVLTPQAGIQFTLAYLSLDPYFYPSPYVAGGGTIDVFIGGRKITSSQIQDSINSTVKQLISGVNKTYTSPDYLAFTPDHNADPATIRISINDGNSSIYNGLSFSVSSSGSVNVISSFSGLTGGVDSSVRYVQWEENSSDLPNANLKLWGTKRLVWDNINVSTWDDGYAHGWYDFEYNNDWLGGFSLYGLKYGDHVKVSPGSDIIPFPTGITFEPATGSTGPMTLSYAADLLNSSTDPNITNFHYWVYPSSDYGSYSFQTGATGISTQSITGPTSAFPAPPSVPGANPVLFPNFTYATGP